MTCDQGMTVFIWLFIAVACLAAFWQIRADYYKERLKIASEAFFLRTVKEYFDQMTDEEIIRCISPEMLHGRIAAIGGQNVHFFWRYPAKKRRSIRFV